MRDKENAQKSKKRIIKGFIIILAVLAVLGIATLILERCANKATQTPEYSYDFSEPDYEENIFENQEYLAKDRYISYTDDMGVTTKITDENYGSYGVGPSFFALYFYSLENADYETYSTLFTEDYLNKNTLKKDFTKQKIYNIEIAHQDTEQDGGDYYTTYSVDYYIMKNDGTFRDDMGSDCSRTQLITLKYNENGAKIDSIRTVFRK